MLGEVSECICPKYINTFSPDMKDNNSAGQLISESVVQTDSSLWCMERPGWKDLFAVWKDLVA